MISVLTLAIQTPPENVFRVCCFGVQMDVSENGGTPKSSILIWFSTIFTIHFGVALFLETPKNNFSGGIGCLGLEME